MTQAHSRRCLEAGLIAAALGLLAVQGSRALAGLNASAAWWMAPMALAAGVLCADFASGAVHWFCDRFFEETTPVIGGALIQPFREHHVDPQSIVRHGMLELHGNTAIPVVAALGAAQLVPRGAATAWSSALDVWLLLLCAASMATNHFHMWAHAPSVPRAVRWLQHRGLILSPERHALHHRGGFDRSYCITLGLLNPALDRIDFFGRVERRVRTLHPGRR